MRDHLHPTADHGVESMATMHPAPVCVACATDFSEGATQATEVAANLARILEEPLLLMHVADPRVRENLPEELDKSIRTYAREQLDHEVERLCTLEIPVLTTFREGKPGEVLLAGAAEEHARLLVLGGTKGRDASGELSGRLVEYIAETAPVPSLVVRDAALLLRWMRGERRLRVFVGADFSAASQAALRWVNWLRHIGSCEVIVTVLEPGPCAPAPTDVPASLADDIAAQSVKVQERFFRQLVQSLLGRVHVRVRFEYDLGRSDAHLIQMATDERADLLVFGTGPHGGARRFDFHPVSRGVLRYGPFNIACVPGQPADAGPHSAATTP